MNTMHTKMHESQKMHETMNHLRHSTSEHLHSRIFWAGVGVALLFMAIMTLLFLAISNGFINMPSNNIHMYGPVGY